MIPTSQFKSNPHPWCIVRLLPNLQRQVVARFHRRNDADGYLQILQRLLPTASYVIVFQAADPAEESERSQLGQLL